MRKSDLTDKMKRSFFKVAVVSILLYGCTTWTLNKCMEKSLAATTQECCKQYWTSPGDSIPQSSSCTDTYRPSGKLNGPEIRDTAGEVGTSSYCWRSRDELISDVLLWTPSHGWAKAGRLARTYIEQLCAYTGYSLENLPEAMNDRDGWRETVIRADCVTWWWGWYGFKYSYLIQLIWFICTLLPVSSIFIWW